MAYDMTKPPNNYFVSKASRRAEFSQKIIFVGVHCRRTDFKYHLPKLVDHRFFDKAFDIYRKRYNNETQKVVFLAVSDDNKWIKASIKLEGIFHALWIELILLICHGP